MNQQSMELMENVFERMINSKVEELERAYEITLREQMATLPLYLDSLKVISMMETTIDIHAKPTNHIFRVYEKVCAACEIQPMSQVEFSRFMVQWFDYVVINKKVKGKKYRLFIKISNDIQDKS